ncbi:hypothetical protein SPRG_06325 [Saprolegnia parasitica CBS 223.65]|uniref:Protein Abitram n=1 Tax=Saprolegnia parasitica (strain CBS 223.65) TaxID=695850 RepID=A0A067CBZ6_SAPPC|nr:hypothetical protein SPRG_06325 [Saprolegnia parasitica CBS 223.65]KDO28274.1 hypothetical protein SPRG_06325 [Saprolegnia parasitica CBS 223.65]|eukprot:XP_012201094.1 hypothetical protein SPRG_06325 [Saprolegnia parasitica CBS 223.65]
MEASGKTTEEAPMTTPPAAAPTPAVEATTPTATAAPAEPEQKLVGKKRRRERKQALKKTQLCRHFDKPTGCPYPDCVYAHGLDEIQDGGAITVSAQRKLLREQGAQRQNDKFIVSTKDAKDAPVAEYVARTGSMVDRYYTRLYASDVLEKPFEDQFVNMHSNRLCVLGIAPGHAIFKDNLTVTKVEFEQSVLDNKVSGKKKKGGVWFNPQSIVCRIVCANDVTYSIRSCIRGALIEFNERLLETPELVTRKPFTEGFLAIVRPKPVEVAEIQASLLKHADYVALRGLTDPKVFQ